MSYAQVQDMVDRYGEEELILLTDTTGTPPSVINEARVAEKLEDADAEINGRISARVTVPVTPVPRILVAKACMLARYYLYPRNCPDQVRQDYEDTIAWLTLVADGDVVLGDNASAPTPTVSGGPQIAAPARTFTSGTLSSL